MPGLAALATSAWPVAGGVEPVLDVADAVRAAQAAIKFRKSIA